jgi:tetratricopeptide (TPR) repeat protein
MATTLTPAQIRAEATVRSAWDSERRGEYEVGLLCFSEEWAAGEYSPDISGLPEELAAELRLRFASLLGYQGHLRKIKDSQVRARDILTESLAVFERLGNAEKAAECENHIALSYSRTGEYRESRTWLDAAMARNLQPTSIHRLATIMYGMLIDSSEMSFDPVLVTFRRYEELFSEWADDWIGSSFYVIAGVAFGELGRSEQALRCFEMGIARAEHSSIKPSLASIQNELAHLYMSLGRYEKAHASVDRGIELYRDIGDESREGMLLDTKATIYLQQGNFDAGLTTIERAISVLKDGENKGFLAEAYATEGKILVWLDDFSGGVSALFEAVQLAQTYSGRDFAKTLISQFEASLKKKNEGSSPGTNRANGLEEGELALLLPPALASHDHYQGVRVNNDHLQCVGVGRGSLVIAVPAKIGRGDLVVVREKESGEISCGFYDLDFGVLCLENCDSEPRLFDQDEVTVIGKVVGIAGEPDENGLRKVSEIAERPPTS